MQRPISVEELLRNQSAYAGQIVTVRGQLMSMPEGSLLCALAESRALTPERPRVALDYPKLEERCARVLSPLVGGPYYYYDLVTVSGRFAAGPEPRLFELSALVIHRSGGAHSVPLG